MEGYRCHSEFSEKGAANSLTVHSSGTISRSSMEESTESNY